MKQDYPAVGEQDDAHKIPQTVQQSVAAPNPPPRSDASYVNLYASARYALNTFFREFGYPPAPQNSSTAPLFTISNCQDALQDALMHMHTHSLPEIGRSSSWRLLEAEPRTRCGWDW